MTDVLAELVRSLKDLRERAADLKKQEDALRERIMPLLDAAGGRYHDEVSGLTAQVKKMPRYDYDPVRLHRLVDDGALYESEFAECLKTIVDKSAVETWLKRGVITDRQLAAVAAKVQTSVAERLEIS